MPLLFNYAPCEVLNVVNMLVSSGYEANFVGGCVRDILLKKTPKDFDLCTSARPEQVAECFKNYKTVETGAKHGTLTIISDGKPVEVTSYRIDGDYTDNRHPESVQYTGCLRDDLKRRDFTINAMAISHDGYFTDFFDGTSDIKAGLIRTVGEPYKRFNEDGLRIMRMFRFSAELNFKIEENTLKAAQDLMCLLGNISAERIAAEFNKIITVENPYKTLCLLRDMGAFEYIIPEFINTIKFDQKSKYHSFTIDEHIFKTVNATANKLDLRLAALFHDIAKPNCFTVDAAGNGHFYGHAELSGKLAKAAMERLKYDRKMVKDVETLVSSHMADIFPDEKNIKKWLYKLGEEGLRKLIKLKIADKLSHKIDNEKISITVYLKIENIVDKVIREKQCFSLADLDLDGNEIIEMGFHEGRKIGEILNYLLSAVIADKSKNKKEILKDIIQDKYMKNIEEDKNV